MRSVVTYSSLVRYSDRQDTLPIDRSNVVGRGLAAISEYQFRIFVDTFHRKFLSRSLSFTVLEP